MNPKIVVIDDEINMCKILEKILRDENYDVMSFTNPIEGIEYIKNEIPDVVLTDIKMPEMNGIDVLKKVKEIDKNVEVIILTAYGTIDSAIDAMKLGAFHYITKPFQTNVLLMTITKSLDYKNVVVEKEILESRLKADESYSKIIGESNAMQEIRELIKKVAPSDSTVLIRGESGTGKELVAKALHFYSNRSKNRFFPINCAGIPETLLESELFGYEKGAFTGAYKRKLGVFEVAQNGTIFLDEIGEMSPALQSKLLRVLQNKIIQRVGGVTDINVDVRVVAATNKNLEMAIESRDFRPDLYYRLNVISIWIPPLRDRVDDIEPLVVFFIEKYKKLLGKPDLKIDKEAVESLKKYHWPGNIRELENIIERLAVLTSDNIISEKLLPQEILKSVRRIGDKQLASVSNFLDDKELDYRYAKDRFEKEYIIQLLNKTQGNISEAAKLAGFSRRSLYEKINLLNINLSEYKK